MPSFLQQRQMVTRESIMFVDGDLPAGPHLFQLVVVDQGGNVSAPTQLRIQIVGPIGPPIPGPPIPDGPVVPVDR